MGADLYIKKMDREEQYHGFEVSEHAVSTGYFRDCYNEGGLFYHLKLSWWGLADTYYKNGTMSLKKIPQFKELIIQARKDSNWENNMKTDELVEYHNWYKLLLKFLDLAIEKKSSIICSV